MIIGFVDHASTMNFLPKLAFFYVHENNGGIHISSRHIDRILIDEYIGVMMIISGNARRSGYLITLCWTR
jgi:hypothetical protein